MSTTDYTYLMQLPVQDLIHRARDMTGIHEHVIRALADRLEEHLDAAADYDALNDELMAAAPDLLAALKAVVAFTGAHGGPYVEARLAIAKAEGRE